MNDRFDFSILKRRVSPLPSSYQDYMDASPESNLVLPAGVYRFEFELIPSFIKKSTAVGQICFSRHANRENELVDDNWIKKLAVPLNPEVSIYVQGRDMDANRKVIQTRTAIVPAELYEAVLLEGYADCTRDEENAAVSTW